MLHKSTLLILTSLGLLISSCSNRVEILEQNVSRIIKTLSSDSMKGRHAFDESINEAANFIASEFSEIGLSPLPGETDFLQEFVIYTIKPGETSVSINNRELEKELYFGLMNVEEIDWQTHNTDVHYITKEDNYREKFREYTSDDQSSVIAVHQEHKKWFHRYRSYFTRSNRTFELDTKPNDIFVLHNEPITSLDVHFSNKVKTIELFNVAGMIEGEAKDEIVLFSAHYDHIGVVSPMDEDSIANGANDNASGVAGVIELARHFESLPQPKRTLYFVGFTAEETGGYGSRYFSEQITPEQIIAMFNIEMIGKPAVEGPNTAWITGFEHSSFGEILQSSTSSDSSFAFYPDPYPNQNLFYRSDNTPLARLGIPAHSISTTPIDVDQDYHKVTDEFNTLHIPHTTNTIRAIAHAAKVIISGEKTPTRISPESLD